MRSTNFDTEGLPTLVSELPKSPFIGQEVYFQTAAMKLMPAIWHLRYPSGDNVYPWLFIGGSPIQHEVASGEFPGSALAWVNLTTPGPLVTIPLSGIYNCLYGANILLTVRNIVGYCGLAVGDTTPTEYMVANSPDTNTAYVAGSVRGSSATRRRMTLVAGNILKHRYQGTLATGQNAFNSRWLDVTPIAVG